MQQNMKNKMQQQSTSTIPLSSAPSIFYEKFFNRFKEIESKPVPEWDATLIIAYFCKLYKEYYNVDYTFKLNATPSKSYEVYNIKKLSSMLSSDPLILKDYIDWFFQDKIRSKKKRITSMAFVTDATTVNDFKFKFLLLGKSKPVDRSVEIPATYKESMQKHGINLKTYGELSFLKRVVDAGNGSEEHKKMFEDLKLLGMDLSVLEKVK